MSFLGMCNAKCSWMRRVSVGSTNEFGELQFTDVLIASDISVVRQVMQGLNSNQQFEGAKAGDTNRKVVRYYFEYSDDIREGDIIKFQVSEQAIVRSAFDDGGRQHHLKVFAVEIEKIGGVNMHG